MRHRAPPCLLALLMSAAVLLPAQDSRYRPERQQIPTPGCLVMKGAWEGGSTACSPNQHEAWLADIGHWRNERRIRIGYDGSRYDLPALKWTQSSFFQPQLMMVEDRYFYDPVAHRYTVDRRDVPDRVCNGNLSRGTRTFARQVNTDCYVAPAASTDPYWVNQAVLNFAEHRGNERRNNLVGLVLATGMCPSRKPSVFLAKDASFSSVLSRLALLITRSGQASVMGIGSFLTDDRLVNPESTFGWVSGARNGRHMQLALKFVF